MKLNLIFMISRIIFFPIMCFFFPIVALLFPPFFPLFSPKFPSLPLYSSVFPSLFPITPPHDAPLFSHFLPSIPHIPPKLCPDFLLLIPLPLFFPLKSQAFRVQLIRGRNSIFWKWTKILSC